VLTSLAGFTAITVCGGLIWALYQGNKKSGGGPELYNTETKTTPEGLSTLPRDYAGIPQNNLAPSGIPPLGPPLPGDLGRPVLRPQTPGPGAVDPEEQRIAQETEAARTSRLFATTNARERPATPAVPPADQKTATPAGQTDVPPLDPESLLNMQDRKSAFLNGPVDRKTVSPDRLENPVSRYVVQAGAVIPAALVTGIRSDLPGQVTAQVTENVYDSPSGMLLLIPQGSKLVGVYDSQISFGQDRVLLVWVRLIMPNGRSIVLERQPGADTQGFAGLEDEVDQHWGRLAMAAALSTVLGVGSELGAANNDSAVVTALRRGTTDSLNQTGQQVVRRNLNIQPTITIRPGFPPSFLLGRYHVESIVSSRTLARPGEGVSRHRCTLRPLNRNAKPLFADIEHYSFLAEAEELGTLANDH
jgi:type IV secretory pathway VirB10-like protein